MQKQIKEINKMNDALYFGSEVLDGEEKEIFIKVSHFFEVKPDSFADNDMDYKGYVEFDFCIYDQDGCEISWQSFDQKVMNNIEEFVIDACRNY